MPIFLQLAFSILPRFLDAFIPLLSTNVFEEEFHDWTGRPTMTKDVICGMNVEEKGAKYKSDYKGKVYYFCSGMCKEEFDKNPEKYLG